MILDLNTGGPGWDERFPGNGTEGRDALVFSEKSRWFSQIEEKAGGSLA